MKLNKTKEMTVDERLQRIEEINSRYRKAFIITKIGNFLIILFLVVFGFVFFVSPEVFLSEPVGFLAGIEGKHYSGSLMEQIGENIQRNCGGKFECVVRDSLYFSSRGIVYEFDSVFGEINSLEDSLLEGADCENKCLVFCGLLMESNFRCSVVGVSEKSHAFSRAWSLSGEEFCFDATGGIQVDCSNLENGVVVFDSREFG